MPADSHALTGRPSSYVGAHSVHQPDNFVSRYARVLQAGKGSLFSKGIAMTNPAGLNLDPYRSRSGLRYFAFHNFQWPIRARDLNRAHFGHAG